MVAVRRLGLAGIAALGLALAASAAAEPASPGLAGFPTVDLRIVAPSGAGRPCTFDEQSLRNAVVKGLGPSGPQVGTSALTLRLRVTTLHDAIANTCFSALELTALTSQKVIVQANRVELITEIPLWDQTTLAVSPSGAHLDRVTVQIGEVTRNFVGDWRLAQ
jgi:hypothetical protein